MIASSAKDVIFAVVAEACMTCKKGCNSEGVSNSWISI